MPDKCQRPERECPITSDFLEGYGEMKAQVAQTYQLLANGNGLIKRVRELEDFAAQTKGGAKAFRYAVIVIGLILTVLQIVILVKGKSG